MRKKWGSLAKWGAGWRGKGGKQNWKIRGQHNEELTDTFGEPKGST